MQIKGKKNFSIDFSFFIENSIPSKYIVGTKYPKKIPDPLFNNRIYDVKQNRHSRLIT